LVIFSIEESWRQDHRAGAGLALDLVGDALQIVDVPGSHSDLGREASSAYAGPILAEALNHLP
jgi:hypothetical protein